MDAATALLARVSSEPIGTSLIEVLDEFHCRRISGVLRIASGAVEWSVELEDGLLRFASHDIEPLERLFVQLNRLDSESAAASAALRRQLEEQCSGFTDVAPDQRALRWLVDRRYLSYEQASLAVARHTQEAIEGLLAAGRGRYSFRSQKPPFAALYRSEPLAVVATCLERQRTWRTLFPEISSAYQRPCFPGRTPDERPELPRLHQRLQGLLNNHSFRQLSALLDRDELDIASGLAPYIQAGVVVLLPPEPPYHLLPLPAGPEHGR